MPWKKLLLTLVGAIAVTACAGSNAPALRDLAQAREEGLVSTSISAGACDGVGQMIPGQFSAGPYSLGRMESVSLEASAAPTH